MTRVEPRRAGPGDWLAGLVSKYWLKKRFVLAQRAMSLELPDPNDELEVLVRRGGEDTGSLLPHHLDVLASVVGTERLSRRLEHPEVTLVLAVDRASREPMGFRWLLHPKSGTVWHDSFPVEPGTAYGFNEYTFPRFRRRGVYLELIRRGNRLALQDLGCSQVVIVVEAGNDPSLRANLGAGYTIEATNYLVKVLGRNVFSVVARPDGGPLHLHRVLGQPREL